MRDSGDQPVRVLIVENDSRVRTALRTFLSSKGFDVVGVAADPATALEIARELMPAVAVVDVFLPDADRGLVVVRALAGELGIPAVAISVSYGVAGRALAAGAYRFLSKDQATELLPQALHAAVSAPREDGT
jgi:DNA-binding NarL/FixJ family response regulator